MLETNFWQDKSNSQKVVKEKKFVEDLINSLNSSVEKLNDFKDFIKQVVKKSDARPFKAAKDTIMMVVDPKTGQKAKFTSKNTIIEVFKKENLVDGKVLYPNTDRLDNNNILKFY